MDKEIKRAIDADGAIRIFDGRWSGGFVDDEALIEALRSKELVTQTRSGIRFAVLPKKKP